MKTMALWIDWPFTFSLHFTSHVIHFVLIIFVFSPIFPLALSPHSIPLFSSSSTHPAEFVLALGAGVHEGLGDDRERGVHHFRHVDVEDEVGILEDVHPEPQRKAARGKRGARKRSIIAVVTIIIALEWEKISSTTLHLWIHLSQGGISCVRALAWGAIECSTR